MKLTALACSIFGLLVPAYAASFADAPVPASNVAVNNTNMSKTTTASADNGQSQFTPAETEGSEPEVWFNPALLAGDTGTVADLETFQKGQQIPGVYLVEIYLNGDFLASRNQLFIARPAGSTASKGDDSGLVPELTMGQLEHFGVKSALLALIAQAESADEGAVAKTVDLSSVIKPDQPVDLEAAIPHASTAFDFNRQRLDISIPQAALDRRAIGEVPEYLWDEGVNAFLLSYNFAGSQSSGDEGSADSQFLSLNSGLNIGAWRLRDQSTWNKSNGGSDDEWQHVSTTLSRAIIPLKSELVIGDSSTGSEVFDSFAFRGMQLSTDDAMYPDSQQGYAPTVRGVAKSNAKVTIKQDARLLYQTYVAPGPFVIEDLFSTYDNGDLQVEIEESDGSITRYSVPYSAVPNMLREGRTKYGLTVGTYRAMNDAQNEPTFLQGSLVMGLADGFSLFGGTQLSEDYRSVAMGVSKNMGDWGGVSADLTHAFTTLPDGTDAKGQSVRFLYSKSLNDYGTDLELVNARYSTEEFYSLADSTYKSMSGFYTPDNVDHDSPDWAYQYNLNYAKRGRMEVNLSQKIDDVGSVFLNLSKQTYWNTDDEEWLVQLGHAGSLGPVTYNLAYNHSKSMFQPDGDKVLSLNISFPIGQMLLSEPQSNMYANYSSSYDDKGNSVHNVGLNGVASEDDSLSYSLQQGYDTQGRSATGSASLRYTGAVANGSLGYNYGEDRQQVNYGLSGGMIAHSEGVTFGQPLGNTNVLIAAPGADGVRVKNRPGNYTDWRGYGIVSSATDYRNNRIELDLNSLAANVELEQGVDNVVPTTGAVVKADFVARVGVRALLTLTHGGRPVPFGARVSDSANQASGIVSDEGVVYLSGLPLKGKLKVKWGAAEQQSCHADYQLPEPSETQNITRVSLTCQ